MRRFTAYLWMQGKRGCRLFPKLLLVCLLSVAVLAGLIFLFFANDHHEDGKEKLKVGIVGTMDNNYLGYGLTILQTADSSRYTLDYVECTKEEAEEMLYKGELNGYVVIPEGWMESIMYGTNDRPISYVVAAGQTGIAAIFMDAVADVVSNMVLCAQEASIATADVMRDRGVSAEEFYRVMEKMDVRLFNLAIQRGDVYEMETLGVSAGTDYAGFYFCTLLLFLLMLSGLWMGPYFFGRKQGFQIYAGSRGIGPARQIFGEWIPYLLMVILLFGCLFFVGIGLTDAALGKAEGVMAGLEFGFLSSFEPVAFFAELVPVFLLVAAWQFFLYEISGDIAAGLMLQFLTTMLFCFLSGYFYPAEFFPKSLQIVGKILPTGMMKARALGALSGEGGAVVSCMLYGAGLLCCAILVRYSRLQRGEER